MKNFKQLLILLTFSSLLASCSWFSDGEEVRKANEKKAKIASSVSDGEINISIDESAFSAEEYIIQFISKLPKPIKNTSWIRKGYMPAENLVLDSQISDYESYSVGGEPKRAFEITSIPIIAEDKIFTLGGQGELQARNINDPSRKIWQTDIEQEYLHENRKDADWLDDIESIVKDKDEFLGGNICYSLGTIFVTTKRGNVFALKASDGKILWRKKIDAPLRTSPVAKNNILIVTTIENRTFALDAKTGENIWEHEGDEEKNKLASSPAPLINKGDIIITYSSGQVFKLGLKDGEEKWESIVAPQKITTLLPTNNDIAYSPIYHDGMIILVSSDGSIHALDENTGEDIWSFEGNGIIGSPWPVSSFIFAINRFGNMYAISAKTGSLVWKVDLEDPEEIDEDNLMFTPPIMVQNKLYVADHEGTLRAYSTKDGSILNSIDVKDNIISSPVVANGKMFILTNESDLLVME